MVKSVMKIIVFVMGIQSLLGNLEKQGIISGSIKINYPVLQDKIVSIVQSDEFKGLVQKAQSSEITNYVAPNAAHGAELPNDNYYDRRYDSRYQRSNEPQINHRIERYEQQNPRYNRYERSYSNISSNNESRLNNNRCVRHIVRAGDTLSDLAAVYGVSWKVIKKANYIYNERRLQIGQNLIIPITANRLG